MSPDFFSPTKDHDFGADSLKQRLYAGCCDGTGEMPAISPFTNVEELKKLTVQNQEGDSLSRKIHAFKARESQKLNRYLHLEKKSRAVLDNALYLLEGWNDPSLNEAIRLTKDSRRTTGGYFIKWEGKGIAINPGRQFLKHFHEKDLSVREIDAVIVTDTRFESYCDIHEIYALNAELNKMGHDLHIIHYYLKSDVYQKLLQTLKPHYKQERNSLHELAFFDDSPVVEKIELIPGIALSYFQTALQHNDSPMACRFELSDPEKSASPSIQIGFVNAPWTPLLSHHLGPCDILIAGFGGTNAEDIQKKKYNENSLGYFGTFALLEEILPKILISTEFSGQDGDIRLELAAKLRSDLAARPIQGPQPVILPCDAGLAISLKDLKIPSSISREMTLASELSVMRTQEAYGPLQYLAPADCLLHFEFKPFP